MSITITENEMVSDLCCQRARRLASGRWVVDGREGTYDRDQAITAMTIAEVHARGLGETLRYARLLSSWEAQVGEGRD